MILELIIIHYLAGVPVTAFILAFFAPGTARNDVLINALSWPIVFADLTGEVFGNAFRMIISKLWN